MIRPYEPNDQDQLIEVWDRASRVAHPFLSEDFLQTERAQIAEHWLPLAETTVFELNKKVVGFVALVGNEVGGLFVDPDHQRQGIGRALMDTARHARPYLELNVFEANPIGRSFYAACGFEEVGRAIEKASGQPEIRLRLGKKP